MKRSTRVRIPKRLHPSSPLHLSLVRRALSDPDVQFVRRGVDARWYYQEHVSMAQTGFQPALGRIFSFSRRFYQSCQGWLAYAIAQ